MTATPIESVVREQLGLDPAALGQNVLERAVESRMRSRGTTDPATYALKLITESTERTALASELAVSETWFFRGGRPLFERLAAFVADRPGARVLSVPCSTGEEPYSLAIALQERFLTPNDTRIDAIDISERALAKAALARYGEFTFREAGEDLRPIYFRRKDESWELLPHLRNAVHFRLANLTEPNFLANERPYDLILCRNLFIYLTPEARVRAMTNLERLLAPEGRLCMTPTEADRLPSRFVLDGPTEFGIYRRATATDNLPPRPPSFLGKGEKSQPTPPAPFPLREGGEKQNTVAPQATPSTPPSLRGKGAGGVGSITTARTLADAGRLDEAQAICEQLLRVSSADVGALALLGVIYLAAGRESDAYDVFRKVLYLAPDHPEALAHMIGLCTRRGDHAQASALRRRLGRVTKEDA